MCEVSKTVKDVVDKLRNNPVFYMSLGSKELFHSNMLAFMLENEWINGLEELFAPYNGKDKLNDYKVLTVLREKSHFDLIIVFLPSNDYDATIKDYNQTEIADIFQNSGPEDELLLSTLKKNCKFVVVENKLKSIPDKTQLEKYDEAIQNRIWLNDVIVLNTTNTTRYLMAPKVALYNFEEYQEHFDNFKKCQEEWNPVSYEDILEKLQAQKEWEDDRFTEKFIEHYVDFLKNMLKLTEDIEKKLYSPTNLAFPKQRDIAELSKIRIHDFYEKLWFSVLLSKIKISDKTVEKGIWYSNSSGLIQFQIIKDNVAYGVQIQQGQFRFFVVPKSTYKWKDNPCPIDKINNYLNDVLSIMKQSGGNFEFADPRTKTKMCNYGDFKYKYIKKELLEIDKKSIVELETMINNALDAINNSDKKTLEAEQKKPSQSAVEQKGGKNE